LRVDAAVSEQRLSSCPKCRAQKSERTVAAAKSDQYRCLACGHQWRLPTVKPAHDRRQQVQ
jgi:hypothetical protein